MNRPVIRIPLRATSTAVPVWKRVKWLLVAAVLIALVVVVRLCQIEFATSRWQARYLSSLASDVGYTMDAGPSDSIRYPASGPYDVRLGYSQLPDFERRLAARGYTIAAQARGSERLLSLADEGLFLPYDEKDQAGLTVRDARGEPIYDATFPHRVYQDFDAIPPLVVRSLLFIEDRYLLDPDAPNRNPAIDWRRFGRALSDQALRYVNHNQQTPGGSTLATQIEKFRHSPDGRTATPPEKLRQIASASVRAYLDGPQTLPARRQIVVRYLNSVPLAARARVGEVTGIGDGLAAWYGRDFNEVNRILAAPPTDANRAEQAATYREVLSLLIAQRAPSFFLNRGYADLQKLTDSYLRLLANEGAITPALPAQASYVARKAITSTRSRLLGALGLQSTYQLDRLDLDATVTLDNAVQQAVADRLAAVTTRDGAKAAGLIGQQMLRPGDDPSKISYSFTLYERQGDANLLRVQTDSVDQPFDVNRGARLNLGSTAKLRTVVTYLQIVSRLHDQYAPLSTDELKRVRPDPQDALTRWSLDYLIATRDRSLAPMLDAALERRYSASPGETFYTGGGAQTFTNFEKSENGQILTIRLAFRNSVNLVFVRLMRDIVRYEMVQTSGVSARWLDDPDLRARYLAQFVDQESRVYVKRFYVKYAGKPPDDALALMLKTVRKSPPKVATVLRSVAPDAPRPWFDTQMKTALKGTPAAGLADDDLAALYAKYGADRFSLNDRGYIASVHPLALWTLAYLRVHPDATLDAVQGASHDVRFASYAWLYKTRYHATQDRRIRRMVELSAYQEIGRSWQALGYPFAALTPSYAAAIGASGDQPDALAKLIGLVTNGGAQVPTESVTQLAFAKDTPYETHFVHAGTAPKQLLSPEIAAAVQPMLRDVVQNGTGKRLAQGMTFPDGTTLEVFGKTGTGDQRFNVYAPGARLIESRKVNRSATFVFGIGDRFFGVLTANTHEPYAARYEYTSALAVQLLKSLAPALQPLVEAPAAKPAVTTKAAGDTGGTAGGNAGNSNATPDAAATAAVSHG